MRLKIQLAMANKQYKTGKLLTKTANGVKYQYQ
jgi:hypothetical protein